MDWSHRLVQPDRRSCGAAVLVVARMLDDPAYAALVEAGRHPVTGHTLPGDDVAQRFAVEVLSMHRRTTGPVDVGGALQLPWPRALGTPPWAVARQLRRATGPAYRPEVVSPFDRARALRRIESATTAGHAVPLYVGSRWAPRHVVLVLDAGLRTYDPARGTRVQLRRDAFLGGRLGVAGWDHPWFSVLPAGRRSRA